MKYTYRQYKEVMTLRKEKLSARKISSLTGLPKSTVGNWIYDGRKPWFDWAWKPSEILFLTENYNRVSTKEIAGKIGRSVPSIYVQASKLALRKCRGYKLPKSSFNPSNELAELVGIILGDGFLTKKNRIGLKVKDKDFLSHFVKLFQRWSGKKVCFYHEKGGTKRFPTGQISSYCPLTMAYIGFKGAYDFLKRFKEDPTYCIEFFPKDCHTYLLRGLFDSDAEVRLILLKSGKKCNRVCFYNTNKQILKLVSTILQECNIDCHVYRAKTATAIYITGYKNLEIFRRKIGFYIERKKRRLNFIRLLKSGRPHHV